MTRTPELADILVAGLSVGTPLRQLCRDNGISKSAAYEWFKDDEELAGRIACARAEGYDAIAEECLAIADDASRDTKVGPNGGVMCDAEWVTRSRLRVDTRLKLLAKWDPKRYGDKVALTGGSDDDAPIKTDITVRFIGTPE